MHGMNTKFGQCLGRRHVAAVAFALFALLATGYPGAGLAQPSSQKTFQSAEEATHALIAAVQNQDQKAITKILGAGKELTTLDDEVQNKVDRQLFIEKYQQMHRLVTEPDGTTVLYVGAENWPFPVPLVSASDVWYFDSAAGAEEVLFRRIGENEAAAIYVCDALVLVKKQLKTRSDGDDSVGQYPTEARSVIRALATGARNSRSVAQKKAPLSFHGYYFRALARQGNTASSDKTSSDFAFIAYPTEYRSSGVMTFIVNQNDVVYEKDLGPNTAKLAKAMTKYNPDSTWNAAE